MSQSRINLLEVLLRGKGQVDGRPFSETEIEQLLGYYQLVLKWNPRLHLTTLSEPGAFFARHLQESEFAESFLLPEITHVWDLGTGLGIPGIPLAILRKRLKVNLVESKRHKAIFLEEVAASLKLDNVSAINSRIESLGELPALSCLMARAVEQMSGLIPSMLKIGKNCSQMLFFGSHLLTEVIQKHLPADFDFRTITLPDSDHRFLINLKRST